MNTTLLERNDCQESKMPIEAANAPAVPPKPRTSRWAIAGVLIAFASFVIWSVLSLATPLLGVIAAVFGLVAKMRIRRNPQRFAGRTWAGIAIAGGFLNLLLLTGLLYLSKSAERERFQYGFYG